MVSKGAFEVKITFPVLVKYLSACVCNAISDKHIKSVLRIFLFFID
jgi:hypothetical protein